MRKPEPSPSIAPQFVDLIFHLPLAARVTNRATIEALCAALGVDDETRQTLFFDRRTLNARALDGRRRIFRVRWRTADGERLCTIEEAAAIAKKTPHALRCQLSMAQTKNQVYSFLVDHGEEIVSIERVKKPRCTSAATGR